LFTRCEKSREKGRQRQRANEVTKEEGKGPFTTGSLRSAAASIEKIGKQVDKAGGVGPYLNRDVIHDVEPDAAWKALFVSRTKVPRGGDNVRGKEVRTEI